MHWLSWGALLLTILLFSTFEVVSKIITAYLHPAQINFLRFFFGGLLLFVPVLSRMSNGQIRLRAKDFLDLSLLGLLNVTVCLTSLQLSIKYITASAAAVIFCSNPLFAHLGEAFVQKRLPSPRQFLGLAVSSLGLFLVGKSSLMASRSLLGIGLALFAAATYGIYIVAAKNTTMRLGSLVTNSLSFLIGSLATIPIVSAFHSPLFSFDLQVLPWMIYLIIGVTVVAYYSFLYALEHLPAGTGSLIFFLKPVLATSLAAWYLKETVTLPFLLGTAAIVFGLALYLVRNEPQA